MPTTTYLTSAETFVVRGHSEVLMSERCVLVWDRSTDAVTRYESLACVELGHRAGCEHSEVPMISRPIGPCSVCSEPVQQGQQYVNLRRGIRHQGCKRTH